ncbi:MAG: hypothetical protein IKB74_04105 [Lentisphaeria bacterium]|nr:hypothetical protein [Lentisphaeria bacterium]
MKNYLGITALFLSAAAVLGGSFALLLAQPAEQYQYLLKDCGGLLAVYRFGQSEPEMILQVFTHSLPEYDRTALQTGIAVADYRELIARIEDFSS